MSMHENGQMNELLNQELFRSMARVKLNLWDISSRLLFANYSFASFLYPHYLTFKSRRLLLKRILGIEFFRGSSSSTKCNIAKLDTPGAAEIVTCS